MASKPVLVPVDCLICTIHHLAMINRTYKYLWCMQGQHWINGFRRTLYVVQACCVVFFFTHSRIVRAMWAFLHLSARCNLHTAEWTKGSFVGRDDIINVWQKSFCPQLFWHIAPSVPETICQKRLQNGYKARSCDT